MACSLRIPIDIHLHRVRLELYYLSFPISDICGRKKERKKERWKGRKLRGRRRGKERKKIVGKGERKEEKKVGN